jgi:hypothetical protein
MTERNPPPRAKTFNLTDVERSDVREALYTKARSLESGALEFSNSLPNRRVLERHADALRRLAERFDD